MAHKTRKLIGVILMLSLLVAALAAFAISASAADTTVVFEFGANGSASHEDGSSKTSYSETVGNYTLNITGGTSMYTGARDIKGNSCIKLGTSSKTGGFSFTVPADVTSVIINIGKYKTNASKITVNGTAYTLTKNSNDGAYDAITVDTSSDKTVSLTTVSGGLRAMVNSITYVISAPASADCDHASLECGDTCPECGEFTKEHKFANNCVAECENDCGTSNPNYADHVYSGKYDVDCDVCQAKREVNLPAADSELTIPEAIELGENVGYNCYTESKYYIVGVITEVYNTTYGNLYITDGENTFTVYGLYDGNGNRYDAMTDKPVAGNTIKVYGIVGNYNGTAQMKNADLAEVIGGCEHEYEYDCSKACSLCGVELRPEATCASDAEFACLDGNCDYCGEVVVGLGHAYDDQWDPDCNYGCGETREVEERPQLIEATITFDENKTQRTEYSTSTQKWESGTLIFTNNKGGSTTNVGDYSNPGRFYKSSTVIIAFPGMTSLVINAEGIGNDYLWEATLNAAGLTYTVANKVYTITFATPVDSITLTAANQVRANSITATAAVEKKCEHTNTTTTVNATCTEAGTTTVTCDDCEEVISTTNTAAFGHSVVNGECERCEFTYEAEEDFVKFKGAGIRFETANGVESPDLISLRFGYEFANIENVLAWGWTYSANGVTLQTPASNEHNHDGNVTNLVLTGIPATHIGDTITVNIWYQIEVDGVVVTVYHNDQERVTENVLKAIVANEGIESAKCVQYAKAALYASGKEDYLEYQEDYTAWVPTNSEEE